MPDRQVPTPDELDPAIHERVRLSIASILASRRRVSYLELRSLLGVTDGNLAGHLRVLETSGYVAVEKSFLDRKSFTTYSLTHAGRRAFQRHVELLGALLSRKSP
jgi:DNA-binding MarR family transcriptional regulator